MKKQSAQGGL